MASVIENCRDAELFQRDIDRLVKWASKWARVFNEAKCKMLHMGRNNPKTVYTMIGVTLGATEEERDLGVMSTTRSNPALSVRWRQKRQTKRRVSFPNLSITGQKIRSFLSTKP